MNILVTGDTGFIGSFLVKRLEELGHVVSGLNTKNGNITDLLCVNKCVKDMDVVFHLASISSPVKADENPDEAYNVIYRGSENVSLACNKFGAKFVFISSRSVYGEGMVPTTEDCVTHPVGWYGTYKLLGEKLCTPADMIFRLSNVYGLSDKCHSVVTRMIRLVKEGESIPIFKNFDVTRDFAYVDDIVDGLILGIDNSGVYNLGSGVETSFKVLIETISKVVGVKYNTIDMKRMLDGEVLRVCLDVGKIKMNLGWMPKVSLEEGIKRCLIYE